MQRRYVKMFGVTLCYAMSAQLAAWLCHWLGSRAARCRPTGRRPSRPPPDPPLDPRSASPVPRHRGDLRPRNRRLARHSARPARRSSTRCAPWSAAAPSLPTRSTIPPSYDFLAAADGAADADQPHLDNGAAMPGDPARARRVLAGRGGGGHAGRSPAARQQDRRHRIGATAAPRAAAQHRRGRGIRKSRNEVRQPDDVARCSAGRAIDLCKDGDPICSGGRNPFAHNDYVSAGMTQQAANFVAGLV